MTRNPPVLPKSAMAIVGTTDKVAAHGTAHDIAMASTRCPQLSMTRVPVVPAIVQPSSVRNREHWQAHRRSVKSGVHER